MLKTFVYVSMLAMIGFLFAAMFGASIRLCAIAVMILAGICGIGSHIIEMREYRKELRSGNIYTETMRKNDHVKAK
jgi:predicted RND superfamily exporter protein